MYPNPRRNPPEKTDLRKRLLRLLEIIILINNNPGIYARSDLAMRYGVSERMIQKDLSIIRSLFRLEKDYRGGYWFSESPFK